MPSLLYFLLRSVRQRGWDQRAPALPLTFTGHQFYLFTTLHLLHHSCGRASVSHSCYVIATYFSCWLCEEAKATLVPLHSQIFHAVPEHVGFNIELKWICQMKVSLKYRLSLTDMCKKHWNDFFCCFPSKNGSWDGNLSTYFNMNTYLDIVLSCVLQQAGKRRIVFSCFDPDICTMWVRVDASANANAPLLSLSWINS